MSERLGQLRHGIEELEKETRSLRTETGELRLGIQSATGRAEAIEVEMGTLRRQVNLLTGSIGSVAEQLAQLAGALQDGLMALRVTASAIESQDAGAARQTAELKSLLIEQQRRQAELTTGLVAGRENIASQLDELARLETVFQENLEKMARSAGELAQGLGAAMSDQLGRLGRQMADLAATEQASCEEFKPELAKILDGGSNLERVLHSVDGNLGRIVSRSEQVLALHQEEKRKTDARDASQLNSSGLKCLGEGNLEGAVGFFERARQLAPDTFEPSFNLAVTYLRANDVEGALTLIAELEARHPGRKELEMLRGASSLSRGDLESAQESLQKAGGGTRGGPGRRDAATLASLFLERAAEAGATGFPPGGGPPGNGSPKPAGS